MGKAGRDPKLFVVVFGQLHTSPLAKGGRAFADVHRHVKHSAAQHAFGAATMAVLHEVHLQASGLVEVLLVEAFKEEAPAITNDFGLEDEHIGDGGGDGWVPFGHATATLCREQQAR